MKKLNEELKILNAIVDSMRSLLGDYANLILRGTNGLTVNKNNKIIESDVSFKNAISALVSKYENVIGNSATINIADSLEPYIKKNRKLVYVLPKEILNMRELPINISKLSKWGKIKSFNIL